MHRRLSDIGCCRILLTGMAVMLLATGGALADPILGSEQQAAGPATAQTPGLPVNVPEDAIERGATVLDITVGNEQEDPNQSVTNVTVQNTGGRRVCVDVSSGELITRSYRKTGEAPFTIGDVLTGDVSGDSGDLKGFNDQWLFILPHSENDDFPVADECFKVGDEAEGCFVPSGDDCPQPLDEGQTACVGGIVSTSECALGDHLNAIRSLRILLALNQSTNLGEIAPAAGDQGTGEVTGPTDTGASGGEPPGGRTGPLPGGGFGGGGGTGLITVPNVVGMSLAQARSVIVAAGLVVGAVQSGQGGVQPAAQADGDNEVVVGQSPSGGTSVAPQTAVNLVLAIQDIPEPATVALFGVGLLLLVLLVRFRDLGVSRVNARKILDT